MLISAQSTTCRPAGRRGRPAAFSLVELLVVLGILTLLATLTLPALMDMTAAKIRLQCTWNMGTIAKACLTFATENANQEFPAGSVGDSETDTPDDYTVVSPQLYTDLSLLGVSDEMMTCQSIGQQDWMFSSAVDKPFRMGVVYWLGRDDIMDPDDDTITLFQSPHRRDRQYDPTSSTVVTCLAYDPYTSDTAADTVVPGSVMPHLGKTYAEYPHDKSPNPWDEVHPDGMAVGFRGGGAKFVKFEDLTPIIQYHRLWYVNY